MCGRFAAVNLKNSDEMTDFLLDEAAGWPEGGFGFKAEGDVFPGDTAPVIVMCGNALGALPMKWGFPGYRDPAKPARKPRPLINARSETAAGLRTWREPLKSGRCLVPADAFYEWSHEKERPFKKWRFAAEDGGRLYLAGLFRDNPDAGMGQALQLFAVMTMSANDSIAAIHDRMPVCVPRNQFGDWLGAGYEEVLLRKVAPFSKMPS
jgi:putative SOS response-associated peptidase YedK